MQPLRQALRSWISRDPIKLPPEGRDQQLVYMLDHKYTDASLSLEALKGSDLAKARALARFAKPYGYVVYLADVERMVNGGVDEGYNDHYNDYRGNKYRKWYDGEDEDEDEDEDDEEEEDGGIHAIIDELETETNFRRLVDAHGRLLATDYAFDEDCIIQPDYFGDCEPDEETDYEGYTGNAGASATHWYRPGVSQEALTVARAS